MRILHWDEMFHPTFGYQINVLAKFQAMLGHDVTIMTSDNIQNHPTFRGLDNDVDIELEDKKYQEKYGVKIIRLPIHGVYSGRVIYKRGFLKKIKEFNPEILMCHTSDTLSSIKIIKHIEKLNVPVIFDNHMLSMASKNPLSRVFQFYYRKRITPILVRNKLFTIRTQDDDYVNKRLGLPENLTPFISFGTDTSLFFEDKETRKSFRKCNAIADDDFVVLYTGKLDFDKGGMFFAEAIRTSFNIDRNMVFVIVGNTQGEYGEKVEKVFALSNNRIIRFPSQKYEDLPKFYQSADLMVFPKQCSLSFYDAQACGLPVVSENNNVNIDRLKFGNGLTFEMNNIEDFRKKICEIAELNNQDFLAMSNNAKKIVLESYDYKHIAKQFIELFHQTINNFKEKTND